MRPIHGLAAAAAVVAACLTTAAGPAAATGETFGCRVVPSSTTAYLTNCGSNIASGQYSVAWQFTGTGTYTYQWTLTSLDGHGTGQVYTGCTSTSSICGITLGGGRDHDIQAKVVATKSGVSITKTSTVSTPASCGNYLC